MARGNPRHASDVGAGRMPNLEDFNGDFAAFNQAVIDEFRNDGGTITSKGPWPLRNKATGQVFGRSVTQRGSHYMEKAEDEGRPMVEAAIKVAVEEFLTL